MGDLSKNFSRWEFECKCGCGFDTVDAELLHILEDIRGEYGAVSISSACRCRDHNLAVGGAPTSHHKRGRAADFTTEEGSPREVAEYLDRRFPERYGIGSYSTFTHFDTRRGYARWAGE